MGKDKKQKVLVLARRQDLCNYAMKLASETCGFEAYGAITNAEGKELLEKHSFVACCLGNVFNNDKYWLDELTEMKALLEARQIPTTCCPTFGDAKGALKELGLYQDPPYKPKLGDVKPAISPEAAAAPAMIAG